MGVQEESRLRPDGQSFLSSQRLKLLAVEGLDIRPLQFCDVNGKTMASATELGMCFQELRQPGSQVPPGPRGRRTPVKVGKDECVEAFCSNDGVERWKIFRHYTPQTQPLPATVPLQPSKGGEP